MASATDAKERTTGERMGGVQKPGDGTKGGREGRNKPQPTNKWLSTLMRREGTRSELLSLGVTNVIRTARRGSAVSFPSEFCLGWCLGRLLG